MYTLNITYILAINYKEWRERNIDMDPIMYHKRALDKKLLLDQVLGIVDELKLLYNEENIVMYDINLEDSDG